MADKYQTCTKESPAPVGAKGRWHHTDCEDLGDHGDFSSGLEYDCYRCRNCGHVFMVEVAQ